MSDKIIQALTEVEIETSDPDRCLLDPDIKERIANRIASFLVKGVGNPNPVYDLLVLAHSDGKYPMDSPQGRGDNLKDYANRMMVMFTTTKADVGPALEGKKMLGVVTPAPQISSHKQLGDQFTEPKLPKAIEKS